MKKKLITEKEIAQLICERGKKCNDHVYTVPILKNIIIEFDGRRCVEDYEEITLDYKDTKEVWCYREGFIYEFDI